MRPIADRTGAVTAAERARASRARLRRLRRAASASVGSPSRSSEGAKAGAGEGNRTLVYSLGSCRSTIELRPQPASLFGLAFRAASRDGDRQHLPNSAGVSLQRPTRWSLCGVGKLSGTHPGFRADHAKGVVVEGRFRASPEAAVLSRAALSDGSTIPVTARFSDSTGIPNVPDGSGSANPHGMAIKYHLPGWSMPTRRFGAGMRRAPQRVIWA
jgi:hypothetical protein